jgi:hypothetical protein
MSRRPRGDDGTVLILATGLIAVCAAVLVAAVDVAALHLQHRSAVLSADGAARAAAQALDLATYYRSRTPGSRITLDLGEARRRAESFLARSDGGRWSLVGVRVEAERVVVDVTGHRRLPFTGTWARDGVAVHGAASAELAALG